MGFLGLSNVARRFSTKKRKVRAGYHHRNNHGDAQQIAEHGFGAEESVAVVAALVAGFSLENINGDIEDEEGDCAVFEAISLISIYLSSAVGLISVLYVSVWLGLKYRAHKCLQTGNDEAFLQEWSSQRFKRWFVQDLFMNLSMPLFMLTIAFQTNVWCYSYVHGLILLSLVILCISVFLVWMGWRWKCCTLIWESCRHVKEPPPPPFDKGILETHRPNLRQDPMVTRYNDDLSMATRMNTELLLKPSAQQKKPEMDVAVMQSLNAYLKTMVVSASEPNNWIATSVGGGDQLPRPHGLELNSTTGKWIFTDPEGVPWVAASYEVPLKKTAMVRMPNAGFVPKVIHEVQTVIQWVPGTPRLSPQGS